jgi:predicted transposase/invertase (TIGR01784 family)
MWQKDFDAKRPLRVIVPVVFYHGKAKWNIPRSFNEQFDVSDEMREFLLNYRYILFDTADWNFQDERNAGLRDNVFLLTALALMKSAFNKDMGAIREIFKFWQEKGFTGNKEKVLFFLAYISETKDISQDKLKKLLEESKIDGGDIMQTLADRLRQEGRQDGVKIGEERGVKIGEERGKLETARKLIARGVDINIIAEATGFSRQEIEKLADSAH